MAPLAQYQGWAPGKTSSFSDGAQGWLLWISLAVMMAESVSSLFVLVIQWIAHRITIYRSKGGAFLDEEEDPGVLETNSNFDANIKTAREEEKVPTWWWALGLVLASLLAIICSWAIFKERMPFYQPLLGNLFSFTSIHASLVLHRY